MDGPQMAVAVKIEKMGTYLQESLNLAAGQKEHYERDG